ncbi:hypothetical protein I302_100474 [Kwoniella bestiolae CBS 10118]|uniref:Uncharacterized protein n=1 Tax=Kwoniella bestiolae CBS 10118 TaxID=1296100 RepID=A0A1B9G558_9TREE|nr:hypothetical protein I302_03847 [Kwoniella bestiolae CBS 10118]OCF26169.1 hypothetical protein I302_03847 [Kwoniella bestiolae CBS 10118]
MPVKLGLMGSEGDTEINETIEGSLGRGDRLRYSYIRKDDQESLKVTLPLQVTHYSKETDPSKMYTSDDDRQFPLYAWSPATAHLIVKAMTSRREGDISPVSLPVWEDESQISPQSKRFLPRYGPLNPCYSAVFSDMGDCEQIDVGTFRPRDLPHDLRTAGTVDLTFHFHRDLRNEPESPSVQDLAFIPIEKAIITKVAKVLRNITSISKTESISEEEADYRARAMVWKDRSRTHTSLPHWM